MDPKMGLSFGPTTRILLKPDSEAQFWVPKTDPKMGPKIEQKSKKQVVAPTLTATKRMNVSYKMHPQASLRFIKFRKPPHGFIDTNCCEASAFSRSWFAHRQWTILRINGSMFWGGKKLQGNCLRMEGPSGSEFHFHIICKIHWSHRLGVALKHGFLVGGWQNSSKNRCVY